MSGPSTNQHSLDEFRDLCNALSYEYLTEMKNSLCEKTVGFHTIHGIITDAMIQKQPEMMMDSVCTSSTVEDRNTGP